MRMVTGDWDDILAFSMVHHKQHNEHVVRGNIWCSKRITQMDSICLKILNDFERLKLIYHLQKSKFIKTVTPSTCSKDMHNESNKWYDA